MAKKTKIQLYTKTQGSTANPKLDIGEPLIVVGTKTVEIGTNNEEKDTADRIILGNSSNKVSAHTAGADIQHSDGGEVRTHTYIERSKGDLKISTTGDDTIIFEDCKYMGNSGISVSAANDDGVKIISHSHSIDRKDISKNDTTIKLGDCLTINKLGYDGQGHINETIDDTITLDNVVASTSFQGTIKLRTTDHDYENSTDGVEIPLRVGDTDKCAYSVLTSDIMAASGAVTEVSSGDDTSLIVTTDGSKKTIKHNIKTDNPTTYNVDTATSGDRPHGSEVTVISQINTDSNGHVTTINTKNIKLKNTVASHTDYGTIKTGYSATGSTIPVELNDDGKAYVDLTETAVKATNALYTVTAGSGLTSTADTNNVTLNVGSSDNIVVNNDNIDLKVLNNKPYKTSPESDRTLTYGEKFTVPSFTVDTYGRVKDAKDVNLILPTSDNTDNYQKCKYTSGLQISEAHYEGPTNRNIGSLYVPISSTEVPGVSKVYVARNSEIGVSASSSTSERYYGVELDSKQRLFVNIPWTDTTNTAGNTPINSTVFLIGATSQSGSSQTYSNSSVYMTNGTVNATAFDGSGASLTNLNANEIKSGTLAVARGGTGLSSQPSLLTNLGSKDADTIFKDTPRPGVTGTLPISNGGTGQTSRVNAQSVLSWIGDNPITSTANDTTANWGALGHGVAFYSVNGYLNAQPQQYGLILNIPKQKSTEIFQLWSSQPNGRLYHRSGNVSNWGKGWTQIIDTTGGTLTGQLSAPSFNTNSDARLKTNFEKFESDGRILNLPTYRFDFIDGDKNQIGCLAQDLQELYPELVQTNDNGYLSIKESKLVYLLLDEVRKLRKEMDELRGK